jgi:hypothetical protein
MSEPTTTTNATGGYTTVTAINTPCPGGHWFIWAGDPNFKIPEGYPCECGEMVAHYETCPHCGVERLILKPRGITRND